MSIADDGITSGPYAADGVNRNWTYDWTVTHKTHVLLQVTSPLGVTSTIPSADFDVSNTTGVSGGTVTYPRVVDDVPLPVGCTVNLRRQTPYEQQTRIGNQGKFYPKEIEKALDHLERQIQQLYKGAAKWGSIDGDIADQLDLMTLLLGKADNALANLTDPGLVPAIPGSTTKWLRGDLTWATIPGGGGGGAIPGGVNGDIQFNDDGALGGFTLGGDATINPATGVLTIGGSAIDTAKLANLAVSTAKIANNAVDNTKTAQMPSGTVKANVLGAPSNAQDITFAVLKASLLLATADISMSTFAGRTLAQHLVDEAYNVCDYHSGAGTGSNDTSFVAAGFASGRNVYLPGGKTYHVDNAAMSANTTLFCGPGAKIVPWTSGIAVCVNMAVGCTIRGLTFDSDGMQPTGPTSMALVSTSAYGCTLRDCTFDHVGKFAVTGDTDYSLTVDNCLFLRGLGHTGVVGETCHYISCDSSPTISARLKVVNSYFEGVLGAFQQRGTTGIFVAATPGGLGQQVLIDNCYFLNCGCSVPGNPTGSIDLYKTAKNSVVSNCIIEGYNYAGFKSSATSWLVVHGLQIFKPKSNLDNVCLHGIAITPESFSHADNYIIVSTCMVDGANINGISIVGNAGVSSGGKGISVWNCTVTGWGAAGTTVSAGIYLEELESYYVGQCNVLDGTGYGIGTKKCAGSNDVSDNTVKNVTKWGIRTDFEGTADYSTAEYATTGNIVDTWGANCDGIRVAQCNALFADGNKVRDASGATKIGINWSTIQARVRIGTNDIYLPGGAPLASQPPTAGDLDYFPGTETDVSIVVTPHLSRTAAYRGQIVKDTVLGVVWTADSRNSNVWYSNKVPTKQILTSGTTWTRPNGCRAIKVMCIGGGGGGAGATAAASAACAGGGGAGGSTTTGWFDVTGSATLTYAVGAAGAAGAAANGTGGAGGSTTFSTLTAPGGAGGLGMTSGTTEAFAVGGAAGAVGSGGSINTQGDGGYHSQRVSGTLAISGHGGSGPFGGGAKETTTAGAGGAGLAPGAGGAGAVSTSASGFAGGAGAAGMIVVEEFY